MKMKVKPEFQLIKVKNESLNPTVSTPKKLLSA
jgi:hypothetical protein